MIDVTLALAEFDRWWAAARKPHQRGRLDEVWYDDGWEDSNVDLHFLEWLPKWYPSQADRAPILEAWEKRRVVERAAREKAEAAERAEDERRRQSENEAAERLRAAAAARVEAKRAADALATQQVRESARAELVSRLTNAAWAHGEDEASLRAVAAWRHVHANAMVFTLKEGAARDVLRVADQALMAEAQASVDAIAAAKARNAQDPIIRAAREEKDEPIPKALDLRRVADQDAIARWLAAHREDLATFEAGRWRQYSEHNDDGEPTWINYEWVAVDGFGEIQRQAARWTAYWAIEAKAGAYPDDADALHELGLKVLTGDRHDGIDEAAWAFVTEKPPIQRIADETEDDDEPEQESRTEGEIPRVRRPRSPAQKRSALAKRIESAIRKGHVTKTAIYDVVGGNKGTFDKLFVEMLATGEISEPDGDHAGYWLDGD